MTPQEFAGRHLQPFKVKRDEIIPTLCPYCFGGKNHDKGTFALNMSSQTFNCMRGSCGKQGHFSQLCKDFGEEYISMDRATPRKSSYRKPQTKIEAITNQAIEYLKLRHITESTIHHYNVSSDDKGNIVFPYYENKELVFVKFRPARKVQKGERKAWRESDTKPILFGMDTCSPENPLCIFEGEIDAMSGYQSGIPNCVSVPSGAEDMTWVETCWEWLKQFRDIVFFGDNDEPGREMIRKLSVRLGEFNLYIVEHEFKDCNELLYRKGSEYVLDAYKKAKLIPVAGLINLAEVVPIDIRNAPKVLSGFTALDSKLGGFMMGDLSVWTGKRGEGKSTILGQLLLNSIEAGAKVCAYSGELRSDRFQYWIDLQAAGKLYIKSYADHKLGKTIHYIEKEYLNSIHHWYSGRFWLFDNQKAIGNESLSILKVFELAASRHGCNVFLVDNLMTARSTIENDKDFYRAQSNFVGELVSFANRHNVHVHLVCHPRKTQDSRGIGNDDISGSGDITNRASNVFSLERLSDEEKAEQGFDVGLTILKNRWEGVTGLVALNYDPVSRRLKVPNEPDKQYSWPKIVFPSEESEQEDMPW